MNTNNNSKGSTTTTTTNATSSSTYPFGMLLSSPSGCCLIASLMIVFAVASFLQPDEVKYFRRRMKINTQTPLVVQISPAPTPAPTTPSSTSSLFPQYGHEEYTKPPPSNHRSGSILFVMQATRRQPHKISGSITTWLDWRKNPYFSQRVETRLHVAVLIFVEPAAARDSLRDDARFVPTLQNHSKDTMGAKALDIMRLLLLNQRFDNFVSKFDWTMYIDDDTYVMLPALERHVKALDPNSKVYKGKTVNIRAYRDPCYPNPPADPLKRKPFTPVFGGSGILFSRGAMLAMHTLFERARVDATLRRTLEQYSLGHGDLAIGFWTNCAAMRGMNSKGFLDSVSSGSSSNNKNKNKYTPISFHGGAVFNGQRVPQETQAFHECLVARSRGGGQQQQQQNISEMTDVIACLP
eukprot:PhM_4_TR15860/c0_g1_i1/m.28027